ncbi:MAG: ECF transporter S component [Calditrichaceae bacterium]
MEDKRGHFNTGTGKKEYFTPKRIARISILIAISAVGSLIKIPSPTGTVSLDACTGYFSAVTFGWIEGSLVGGLGHMLSAFTTGFPLGLPVHLYIAFQMAIWVSVFSIIARKINLILAVIAAIFLNGVVSSYLIIPFGGMGMATALLIPLIVGSAVNIIIAALAYRIVQKSNFV